MQNQSGESLVLCKDHLYLPGDVTVGGMHSQTRTHLARAGCSSHSEIQGAPRCPATLRFFTLRLSWVQNQRMTRMLTAGLAGTSDEVIVTLTSF